MKKYTFYNTNNIDYAKVVMAFLVVAIHFSPLVSFDVETNYWLIQYIARLAVPFYFICNGYFVFFNRSMEDGLMLVKSQAIKLLKLYLIWTVIYSPLIFLSIITKEDKLSELLEKIRNFLFVGSYGQLWYLLSAAVALLLLYYVYKLVKSLKVCIIVATVLYGIGLLKDTYFFVLEGRGIAELPVLESLIYYYDMFFDTTRNGIFMGFVFVCIGVALAQMKHFPLTNIIILGLLASLLVGYIEINIHLLYTGHTYDVWPDAYIYLLPATICLFIILLKGNEKQRNTRNIRKISTLIYLIHMWPTRVWREMVERFIPEDSVLQNSLFGYLLIMLSTLVLCLLVVKLSEKEKFSFLKNLY